MRNYSHKTEFRYRQSNRFETMVICLVSLNLQILRKSLRHHE